jgi:hypothetical protein
VAPALSSVHAAICARQSAHQRRGCCNASANTP